METGEQRRTLSSQIAAQIKLVAQPVGIRWVLLLLEFTKTLHTCWLVARLDPLSMAELLNLQGKCQPLRAKPAHFVSHLPEEWEMMCSWW